MNMQAEEQAIQAITPRGNTAAGGLIRPTISNKFLLVFAALALVGLGNWLVVESTLSRLRGATTQVNIIGNIRWISQRVQLETIRLARGRGDRAAVEARLDKLDEVIRVLGGGGKFLGFEVREPSETLRASIEPLRLAAKEYRTDVYRALEKLAARRTFDDELDELFADGDYLLSTADGIAVALSAQIAEIEKDATRGLYLLALLDLAIFLSVLAAIRIRIVRPLRTLAAASRQFARGSYGERVRIDSADEIGDLAHAFDRMADDIQRDMTRIANDVVELDRAQHGLRKLSKAVEHSPAAVVITDTSGTIEYVNPKFSEATGYSGEESIGRNIGFLKSGKTSQDVYADLWQAISSGREWRGELLNRKKNGELFWEDTRISPLTDELGRTTHFIAVKEDVTERNSAAEKLRRNEALLRKVLDTLPVGVWVTDGSGTIIMGNPAGQSIWTGVEYAGLERHGEYKGWWVGSGKKIEPGEWALARAVTNGETSVGELVNIQCFDGSFKTILNSAVPLTGPNGEIEGAIVVNEDITERQRAAEELRVSKELFQTTFDSAAVGITLCDLAGRFLLVNRALCGTVGYTEDELLRKSFHDIIHPDDLQKSVRFAERLLANEIPSYQTEKRYYHKDGKTVWVLLSVTLVRDAEGAPLYFIGQVLDISARKRMEQQLIESRERLRDLAAHRDAVREEERKRIALEIHDEMGQLLTALKMDISLVLKRSGMDPELARKMSDMRELAEKSIRIVRQVASNLRPAALNLGLVPALEWLVEDFGQRTEIAYELNLSGKDIKLDDMRATAAFRIVQESLTNVARHSGASEVVVSLRRTPRALRLEVADNGRGFEPVAAMRGHSFGLLGIRERVQALGGALRITSSPGKGTVVSIRIPHPSDGQK